MAVASSGFRELEKSADIKATSLSSRIRAPEDSARNRSFTDETSNLSSSSSSENSPAGTTPNASSTLNAAKTSRSTRVAGFTSRTQVSTRCDPVAAIPSNKKVSVADPESRPPESHGLPATDPAARSSHRTSGYIRTTIKT